MITFLDEVVADILTRVSINELKDCTIILPSRRAGLHLKKSFSKKINQTFLLPKITTVNDFIYGFSSFTLVSNFEAQLELYSSYCKIKKDPEPLDSFIQLAPMILNDFNLIDKHLLNTNEFIFDLNSISEIDNWSLSEKELTKSQLDYVEFWKHLGALYKQFHEDLQVKGLATEGAIYKTVSKEINTKIDHSTVFFVGLNALSTAEEKIINSFINKGNSQIYFDGDSFYCLDKNHEAGFFFRKSPIYKKTKLNELFTQKKKEITIYSAKNDVEQVQTIAKILEKNKQNINSCAVYLINEKLINPLIQNIPNKLEKLNITMGYPIINSYCYAFLSIVLSLFDNNKSNELWNKNKLHYQFVEELFTFPFVKKAIKQTLSQTKFWKNKQSKNIKYIQPSELTKEFPNLTPILSFLELKEISNAQQFLEKLEGFIERISTQIESKIEKDCISNMLLELTKLHKFIKNHHLKDKISSSIIVRVVKGKWSSLTTPFYGEPLAGVQIMGFLESRSLDFEHIILSSCNEAYLPGSEQDQSLIPNDLKKHYKIPGVYEKDAMYSYYFYRSIQRAKKIDIIYSTDSSSKLNSAEPSRFIHQIEKELCGNKNLIIKRNTFNFEYNKLKENSIIQDEFSKKQILALFDRGLSASSIKKYLDCPLDFYYKYILKIKEKEIVEETIENSTWGSILHLTLKRLFENRTTISIAVINELRKKYLAILHEEFILKFPDLRFKDGENSLLYHQAIKCLELFLDNEEKNIVSDGKYTILGVEKKMYHELKINHNNNTINVNLKGDIDRIDQTSKGIRIVDYKSGFLTGKDTKMKNFDAFSTKKYCLQLMLYAYLYHKNHNQTNLKSSIISLKNPKANFISLSINGSNTIDENILFEFEDYLTEFAIGLMDDHIEYKHNEKHKYCMIC